MEQWFADWTVKDAVLLIMAAYGALLSTFNWRIAARKEKRHIKVTISSALPTYPDGHVGSAFARVEVANTGQRAVTIKDIALELPSGGKLYRMAMHVFPGVPDTVLPVSLSDGETAHVFYSYGDIGGSLIQNKYTGKVKLRPVCEDSSGKKYVGDGWDIDPAEFSKM